MTVTAPAPGRSLTTGASGRDSAWDIVHHSIAIVLMTTAGPTKAAARPPTETSTTTYSRECGAGYEARAEGRPNPLDEPAGSNR